MSDPLKNPQAAKQKLIDSLVASGGGMVSYEFGAPGREIAIAAGAHLAARTGTSLTVIDHRAVLPQVHATVAELDLDFECRVMSVGEALQHPERNTGGVQVILNVDFPHRPGTRTALLARARAADRLIVTSSNADTDISMFLPGAPFVVSAPAWMSSAPASASAPELRMRFEAATDTSYSDELPELRERQKRSVRQLKQRAPGKHDTTGLKELTEAVKDTDPDELQRRIMEVQEQQLQRAADYPAPGLPHQVTRDHGQEQSTQPQQGPKGIRPT